MKMTPHVALFASMLPAIASYQAIGQHAQANTAIGWNAKKI